MDKKKYALAFVSWVAVLLGLIILTAFVFKLYLPFAENLLSDVSQLPLKVFKIVAIWLFVIIFSVMFYLAVKNISSFSKIMKWFIKVNKKG